MRLTRSSAYDPGIRRLRNGRGFRYQYASGRPVRESDVLERVAALAIPPAWRDVWICRSATGHLQAVGTDDAGRRQYLYHGAWRSRRDARKHDRVVAMAPLLPSFRAAVADALDDRGLGRSRVLAGALRMADLGVFRTGGERYARQYGSRGLATLLRGDVMIHRGELHFAFRAKGGVERTLQIADESLAPLLGALRRARTGSPRLLCYHTADGWREVRAADLNEEFKQLVGADFTVKDLRTWNATVLAAVLYADAEQPSSKRGKAACEAAVMRAVAEELGNTPAVARRSYVDPRVTDRYEEGRTISAVYRSLAGSLAATGHDRNRLDRAVCRLIGEGSA